MGLNASTLKEYAMPILNLAAFAGSLVLVVGAIWWVLRS